LVIVPAPALKTNLGLLCHELSSHAECNSGLSSNPLSRSETNFEYGTHQSFNHFVFPVFGTSLGSQHTRAGKATHSSYGSQRTPNTSCANALCLYALHDAAV